jgi:hypothetical protein
VACVVVALTIYITTVLFLLRTQTDALEFTLKTFDAKQLAFEFGFELAHSDAKRGFFRNIVMRDRVEAPCTNLDGVEVVNISTKSLSVSHEVMSFLEIIVDTYNSEMCRLFETKQAHVSQ